MNLIFDFFNSKINNKSHLIAWIMGFQNSLFRYTN